ncbi:hypothetical protein Z043_117158 [Scleropages formosus]|uniref:Ig-like domain-containing protein n=1 Tax=Scleropages formosus TaxID=113540 RepID=A0A0P7TT93_SCLFO|nr:hypothetical protein Z043_117158 [Scleropages formosus]
MEELCQIWPILVTVHTMGQKEMTAGVTLGAELSFTLEPSDIIAVQRQPLMLHCQVDGIPPITTQWRRNGALVVDGPAHSTFTNGSLLIGHFQRTKPDGSSDEGDYECVAENPIGLLVSRKARVQAATLFTWSSSLAWAQEAFYRLDESRELGTGEGRPALSHRGTVTRQPITKASWGLGASGQDFPSDRSQLLTLHPGRDESKSSLGAVSCVPGPRVVTLRLAVGRTHVADLSDDPWHSLCVSRS